MMITRAGLKSRCLPLLAILEFYLEIRESRSYDMVISAQHVLQSMRQHTAAP